MSARESAKAATDPSERATLDRTSPEELAKVALRYLNRYDASVEQLRRVLLRHVTRHGEPQRMPELRRRIDELLVRYQSSQLLDDVRYAQGMARGLRERGTSTLKVRLKLRQRGIGEDVIERVLAELENVGGDPDLEAARSYARRRRLRSRYDLTDPAQRQKALAALSRQGFSFAIATAALAPEEE